MKHPFSIFLLLFISSLAHGQKDVDDGVHWVQQIHGSYWKNKNNYLIIYSDSLSNNLGFIYELNLKKNGIYEIGRLMPTDTHENDFGVPIWAYLEPYNDTINSIIGSCHLEFDNVGNKKSMTIWRKSKKSFTKNRVLIKLSTTKPKLH